MVKNKEGGGTTRGLERMVYAIKILELLGDEMKARDAERISKIVSAIENAVNNVNTQVEELEKEFKLTVIIPKLAERKGVNNGRTKVTYQTIGSKYRVVTNKLPQLRESLVLR